MKHRKLLLVIVFLLLIALALIGIKSEGITGAAVVPAAEGAQRATALTIVVVLAAFILLIIAGALSVMKS
ncbi:hypothetical protein KY345_06075 [Candidatus Woesearchaeota archaeon]|nr:hypothetical protein [Candidatus Woesearchaeota archaeon]